MSKRYFWGVDCGSSAIKVVQLDEKGKLLAKSKGKTLFPLIDHVIKILKDPVFEESPFDGETAEAENIKILDNHLITATGYGRNHIPFAHKKLTEIKGHFLGAKQGIEVADDFTLIDIGGQDSKIIKVKKGQISDFVINRKCAAGTGAFIEEIAHRLDLAMSDLTELARNHDKKVALSSYCTVFAVQELIKILVSGEKVENLVQALYESVAKRVLEIASVDSKKVLFSGGVMNYHPILLELFQKRLPDAELTLVQNSQFCGATGAALSSIAEA